MNDFDWGFKRGRIFMSFIINDDFFGVAIRVGKEAAVDMNVDVYHATIQIGFGQFTIGITGEE